MNMVDKENLIEQINIVLEHVGLKQQKDNKPILTTIYTRYEQLKHALEDERDISIYSIRGSVRAYLDSYSDYYDPIINELGNAEKMYIRMVGSECRTIKR